MSEFNNVTVKKAANIYFDGKITSRVIILADGSKKTLGIMLPGEYEIGTEESEKVELIKGELEVKLPGEEWQTKIAGESFVVPSNSNFKVKVINVVDYCCSYFA